jgi:hypothetical protein
MRKSARRRQEFKPERYRLFHCFKSLRVIALQLQHDAPVAERARLRHIQLVCVRQVQQRCVEIAATHRSRREDQPSAAVVSTAQR